MTGTRTDQDLRRARWRNYFEQTLLGADREIEAATDAAMAAIARGAGQPAIIAAGRAAARATRAPAASSRSTATPHATQGSRTQTPPRTPPRRPAAPTSTAANAARATRAWPPNSAVVSLVEKRSESMDGQFFQTWSFRLLPLDAAGAPVPPAIPVEMRGRSIIGQLAKGDVVSVPDGRPGQTRIVKSLHNVSTGCVVEAKGRPFRRFRTARRTVRIAGAVLATVVVLAVLAIGALAALHYLGWVN